MRTIALLSILACTMSLSSMDNNHMADTHDLEVGILEEGKEKPSYFKKAADTCNLTSLFFSFLTFGASTYRFEDEPVMGAVAIGSVISSFSALIAAYGFLGINKCLLRSRKKAKLTLKEN